MSDTTCTLTNNSSAGKNEASGPSPSTLSDDEEESSVLADLLAMFPTLDQEVILTVLQAYDGRIQEAVEHLISSNYHQDEPVRLLPIPQSRGDCSLDLVRDMEGQFSEDIGGLPEVLPRFIYDDDTLEGGDEGNNSDNDGNQSGEELRNVAGNYSYEHVSPQRQNFRFDDPDEEDPLPTYEEACTEGGGSGVEGDREEVLPSNLGGNSINPGSAPLGDIRQTNMKPNMKPGECKKSIYMYIKLANS